MSDEVFDDGGEGKEKYIGELYFLRGYTYFYMYRIWGELPIVTTSPDDVINADYVARSPLADVAALIYSDLEEARVRLPWEYEDNANLPCVPIKESYSLPCTYGGLGSRLCQVRGGL